MPELIDDVLVSSSNPLLRFLFSDFGEDMKSRAKTVRANGKSKRPYGKSKHGNGRSRHGGKSRKGAAPKARTTVASSFVVSLRQLMHKLGSAEPHFIRCIKPNAAKKAGQFDGVDVLRQMRYVVLAEFPHTTFLIVLFKWFRYNGMLATVKMRRAGFPQRVPYGMFMAKYKGLAGNYTAPTPRSKEEVVDFLKRLEDRHRQQQEVKTLKREVDADEGISNLTRRHEATFTGWVVGKSKIFLKHWHTEILNTMNATNQRAAVKIQSYERMRQQRAKFV